MREDQEQPAPTMRGAYLTALLARFDTVTLPLGPIEQGMPLRAVFQPLRLRRKISDEAIRKLLELRHDPESSVVRAAADDALAEILSLETGIEDD